MNSTRDSGSKVGGRRSLHRSPVTRRLHRIGVVRRVEKIPRRRVARKLNLSVSKVRQQEHPVCDLPLSQLYEWARVLRVPPTELLTQVDGELSLPVAWRAKLVRMMKTSRALCEAARQESVRRLAEALVSQLIEIMPELVEVTPWPAVGPRRYGEYGIAVERMMPASLFLED